MRHFHGFSRDHHSWHPHVTFAEEMPTTETNMWGRPVSTHSVRCQKEEVCDICGATRKSVSCICDAPHSERCVILQEWLHSQPVAGRK
jgi:hypothetical protein